MQRETDTFCFVNVFYQSLGKEEISENVCRTSGLSASASRLSGDALDKSRGRQIMSAIERNTLSQMNIFNVSKKKNFPAESHLKVCKFRCR